MDCLVTFGLLHKEGKIYSLTDQSAPYSKKTRRPRFQCFAT